MAVPKRLRFEVLRRDNHTCRYCGASAPQVKLTVDHVTPEVLGGSDEPSNLVTACEPCNSGKTSSTPGAPLVEDVRQDALRWARAMELAADILLARHDEFDAYLVEFWEEARDIEAVSLRRPNTIAWPDTWQMSIRSFYKAGLPLIEVVESYRRADATTKVHWQSGWKYFCGICWSKLREMHEIAEQVLLAREED